MGPEGGNGGTEEKHLQQPRRNWRSVAREAASETDPERLSKLVAELCELLDQERRFLKGGKE